MTKDRMVIGKNIVKVGMEETFRATRTEYQYTGIERRNFTDEQRIWNNLLEHHNRTNTGNPIDLDAYEQRVKSLQARIENCEAKEARLGKSLNSMYETEEEKVEDKEIFTYLFSQGSTTTRVIAVNDSLKTHAYYEVKNNPVLTEKLLEAGFKKSLKKEVTSLAIKCYAQEYKDYLDNHDITVRQFVKKTSDYNKGEK